MMNGSGEDVKMRGFVLSLYPDVYSDASCCIIRVSGMIRIGDIQLCEDAFGECK